MTRRDLLAATAGHLMLRPSRSAAHAPNAWTAGAAAVDITPKRSIWMAGFARRTQPSQGVSLPLHAKALALQPAGGRPAVLVTADLLGLTARITDRVAAAIMHRHGLRRADVLFNASHTHCGPVIGQQLSVAYELSAAQWKDIAEYTEWLEGRLMDVIGSALSRMRPARLSTASGRATFGANRRVAFKPLGPVDDSVPVLRVERDGGLLAVVFGYACHNTTLPAGFVRFHGDYAGVAQAALERRHPGAIAMFVAGCGADINPAPRGTLELVEAHGTALADAVDRAEGSPATFGAQLQTAYGSVALPFSQGEARERWRAQLEIEDRYLKRYDALIEELRQRGELPDAQPCPVQLWTFASDYSIVAIGGEVVVDYALRLAREHSGRRLWVAGYSNDVFGYLPSRRVLREGGYEGADAMVYYARPAPFTDAVEELVVGEVKRLMAAEARAGAREGPPLSGRMVAQGFR